MSLIYVFSFGSVLFSDNFTTELGLNSSHFQFAI